MTAPVLLEQLAGHCVAKRAIEVAVAGNHSILLVGARGVGKDNLLAAYRHLVAAAFYDGPIVRYPVKAKAVLPCWCGADDLTVPCQCSKRAKARYARKLTALAAGYDLLVEVCGVPVKEYGSGFERGTTEQALARIMPVRAIQAGRGPQTLEALLKQLDVPGQRTFEMAVRRLGLGCGATDALLRVARTIADLHGDRSIPARCVAEAAQYRALPQLRNL